MRACIYNRVSTEEQLEGYSIGVQDEVNKAFCKARGWEIAYVFNEEGQSGKNFTGRTQWQNVRSLAERKQFDVLVCHKIDRFSRGTIISSLNELEWLRRYQVTFASSSEPLDFTSSHGELMLILFLWFARHYIVNLSTEVTKGRKARAMSGRANSTHPPFGYVRNDAGDDMPVDALRGVITEMFTRAAGDAQHPRGEGDTSISWWLNGLGHRTFEGKPFSRSSVREMLVNRFYIGQVGYAGLAPGEVGERKRNSRRTQAWMPGLHEPMVSEELFRASLAARKRRHVRGGARPVLPYRVYLLREIGVCADCGTRLTASAGLTGRLRYQCLANQKGRECPSGRRMIFEDVLAPQVEAMITALQLPVDVLQRASRLSEIEAVEPASGRAREEITAEMERLDFMFEKGRMTRPAYERKLDVLTEELNDLVVAPAASETPSVQAWTAMLDAWKTGDAKLRHDLLTTMLDAVYVDTREQTIVGWGPKKDYVPLFEAAGLPGRPADIERGIKGGRKRA